MIWNNWSISNWWRPKSSQWTCLCWKAPSSCQWVDVQEAGLWFGRESSLLTSFSSTTWKSNMWTLCSALWEDPRQYGEIMCGPFEGKRRSVRASFPKYMYMRSYPHIHIFRKANTMKVFLSLTIFFWRIILSALYLSTVGFGLTARRSKTRS